MWPVGDVVFDRLVVLLGDGDMQSIQDVVDDALRQLTIKRRACVAARDSLPALEDYLMHLYVLFALFLEPARARTALGAAVEVPLFRWHDADTDVTATSTSVRFELVCAAMAYAQLLYVWSSERTTDVAVLVRQRAAVAVAQSAVRDVASTHERRATAPYTVMHDRYGHVPEYAPAVACDTRRETIDALATMLDALATQLYLRHASAPPEAAAALEEGPFGAVAVAAPERPPEPLPLPQSVAAMRYIHDRYHALVRARLGELYRRRMTHALCSACTDWARDALDTRCNDGDCNLSAQVRLALLWTLREAAALLNTLPPSGAATANSEGERLALQSVVDQCQEMYVEALYLDHDALMRYFVPNGSPARAAAAEIEAMGDALNARAVLALLPAADGPLGTQCSFLDAALAHGPRTVRVWYERLTALFGRRGVTGTGTGASTTTT